MMKRWMLLLAVLLLLAPTALADTDAPRVTDRSGVLSVQEEEALEEAISVVRSAYQFDVVLLTEEDIGIQATHHYAADYYDYGGFGCGENHDGIMLLLVTGGGVGNRDYYILNTGRGEKIFTDSVMYDIEEDMYADLYGSRYAAAMSRFVMDVQARLEAHQPMNRATRLLPFTLGGGGAVGVAVAMILKGQMKTVRRKRDAASYVRDGSFQLTRSQDLYLYTTTTRRRIETQSSGGRAGGGGGGFTGSSGTHHTGHGGKF